MQKAFLMKGQQCVRFDILADAVDENAKPLHKTWPGLPWTTVDAAINLGNGFVYFFKGTKYVRYNILAGKVDRDARTIRDNWSGTPWDRFDAAVNWGNGKAYFFRGDSYARFDIALDLFDAGPRPIHETWRRFPADWKSIDAAVNWGDGKAYLFHGDQYVAYDVFRDRASDKRGLRDYWRVLPNGWNHLDAVVTVDDTSERMGAEIERRATKAVGFAYVIYEGSRLTKIGGGGVRIRSPMPEWFRKFTPNTEIGIGSITKTLTAAAAVKALTAQSRDETARIARFLPKNWKRGVNVGGTNGITFEELMKHTSGFRQEGDKYAQLQNMVANGVLIPLKTNSYCNSNFSLMRVLLPGLLGIPLGASSADPVLAAITYKSWMQRNVFAPSFVTADCRFDSQEVAMLYGLASEAGEPYEYKDDGDDSTMVAGAGGWKMSALELGRTLHTLLTTKRILNETPPNRLMTKRLGCFTSSRRQAWHRGAWNDGVRGYENYYALFSDGVLCLLMTNSKGSNPRGIVNAAHYGAFS